MFLHRVCRPLPLCSFLLAAFFSLSANAQATFADATDLLGQQPFHSGIAVGIADVNDDGLDDLLVLDDARILHVFFQKADGGFEGVQVGEQAGNNIWSMTAGDVDNDGWLEIMTGGYYEGIRITDWHAADSTWQSGLLPESDIFVQGSNFADLDADGWLEAFACHDDAASRLWRNLGNGLFEPAFDWIDFHTTPPSDNSGNYGSVWTDFDTDGDIDLYIAKCRQGVDDPEDARRINVLYENDGTATFAETGGAWGLRIAHQSWTAEFQDIDNDGDFDALVTNHDAPLQLLENQGGSFIDIAAEAGVAVDGYFLQGIMRDLDNDGFVDILLASPARYFHNNGDKTFTQVQVPPFTQTMLSLATGDLDHDGFLDIYVSKGHPYTNPSITPDALWFNEGNDNHWLAFTLEGTTSNRRGTGALIELHGPWGVQLRELRSGESYGITTSLQAHFGLGADTLAPWAVVRWPSGTVDVLTTLSADQFVHVVEGTTCQADTLALSLDGEQYLCPGDTIAVSVAAPDGSTVLWHDGATGTQRILTEPGTYRAVVVLPDGCAAPTTVLKLRPLSVQQLPQIAVHGYGPWCAGDTVWLEATGAPGHVSWQTGDTAHLIAATHPGPWVLFFEGECETVVADTAWLEFVEAPAPAVWPDTVEQGQPALLVAQGGTVQWYADSASAEPLAGGDTLAVPAADSTQVFWAASTWSYGGGAWHTGMPEHAGSPYSSNIYNAGLIFDCMYPFVLHSVRLYTDTYGVRIIELKNEEGEVLQSRHVNLQSTDTVVVLDMPVEPGQNYLLTTNTNSNIATFGFTSPRLRRSDEDVAFPYEVPDVLSIHDTPYGTFYYYYFYDWVVEVAPVICESERVPVELVVLSPTGTVAPAAPQALSLEVWPNPAAGVVQVRLPANFAFRQMAPGALPILNVYDLTGRQVLAVPFAQANGCQIDVSHLPKGIYQLEVVAGQVVLQARLAVQ